MKVMAKYLKQGFVRELEWQLIEKKSLTQNGLA